jgi:putative hydrolase of the HAD superfamily
MGMPRCSTLFLDIGGVLLTNGWDESMRRMAAATFGLSFDEVNARHHVTFDTYEEGKLSLDEYLHRVVFYEPRTFTPGQFKAFMFSQSQPYPRMIEFVKRLKARHGLKLAAVSNEGRELNDYRIRTFGLSGFIESFISSSFVHLRKPDEDIFRMAIDIAQVPPEDVIYIEDQPMFVEVARGLGIRGLVHTGFEGTRDALAQMGLAL